MDARQVSFLVLRYLVLIVLGMFNLILFYAVFTPLTFYPVVWFLGIVDSGTRALEGNVIFFSGQYAEIISACVAGAAYYLLTILNFSTPMSYLKRVKSLSFLLGGFLLLNVIRILIFAILLVNGYQYFDAAHRFTWYFGSTILVVLVWFGNVWLFKIKDIPVYTDMKALYGEIVKGNVMVSDKKSKKSIKVKKVEKGKKG